MSDKNNINNRPVPPGYEDENIFKFDPTTKDLEGAKVINLLNNADNVPSGFVSFDGENYKNENGKIISFDEVLKIGAEEIKRQNVESNEAVIKQKAINRINRYSQRRRGGVLRYPLESLTDQTDYLQIDIEKYVPIGSSYISAPGDDNRYVRGNFQTNRAGRRSSRKLSNKPLINAGTILLPIPANLQDTNNVRYDTSSLNGLAAAGVNAVTTAVGGNDNAATSVSDAIKNIGKGFTELGEDIGVGVGNRAVATDIINKQIAASAVNIFGSNVTVNQLLARGNGEVINPNMELLFGGPTLRNFRFNFKFTPRNEREAEQVKLIIRAFKRNMAPQAQGGTLDSGTWFLKTPNIFKLRYRSGNRDHPFLNKFKQCFLSDMQTTYTAEGVYSTYDDKTPVSMQLDLSFKEIEPIYDIDYDVRPGDKAVGY